MDFVLPPTLYPAEVEWTLKDYTGVFESQFSGATRTVSRGQRWGVRLAWQNVSKSDRAQLAALVAALRGKANRLWVGDPANSLRGSFPDNELLANADFSQGTTGWTTQVGTMALTATGRVARGTRVQNTGANTYILYPTPAVSVTAYAPYVARYLYARGSTDAASGWSIYDRIALGRIGLQTNVVGFGLLTAGFVTAGTTVQPALLSEDTNDGAWVAGDYVLVPYATLQQCALLDNQPNALTYPDDFSQAAWTKTGVTCAGASINYYTAPNGAFQGDRILEDTSTGRHYAAQTYTKGAIAQDWCGAIAARKGDAGAGTRDHMRIVVGDNASNYAEATFDLSGGVVSSSPVNHGTVTNGRAFIASLGNGWYYCALVANVPSGITTTNQASFDLIQGTVTTSYTGDGASNLGYWGATYAASSVPVRLSHNGASAQPSGASPTGNYIYLKGLPVSTNGLALAGDMIEVYGELKRALSDLNSDAAGLGHLRIEPALRSASMPDNGPIIFGAPMGKFLLAADSSQITRPGFFSDFELQLVEVS